MRRIVATAIAAAGLVAGLAPAGAHAAPAAKKKAKGFQRVQVLAINDFHGNLEPPSGSSGRIPTGPTTTVDAGGAAFLATHLKRLRKGPRPTLTVGAGDLIGASPLISGLFHDEPTVEALNRMKLKYSAVGNHEFDEGVGELLRLQRGGCHPTDEAATCIGDDPFTGASFRWLAANVTYAEGKREGKTILPPYKVFKAGKGRKAVKVGFIGLTLEDTPAIVTPEGVAGLRFADEAKTVNKYARRLTKRGVEAIFVLLHEGGQQNEPFAKGFADINGCENLTGDVVEIVDGLSEDVDAIASAHTHNAYNCRVDGRPLTSAASFGRVVTNYRLKVDRRTHHVVEVRASNVVVTRDVPADKGIQALVDRYKAASTPIANRVVGSVTADLTREANPAGESSLGDVIADAQLAASAAPDKGAAKVAFMNPGGIRADIVNDGAVTYGDLYATQPFANTMVVKTMTGELVKDVLEQQFDNPAPGQSRILQVSNGFTYAYDLTRPAGQRVDPASIQVGGVPLAPGDSVRVAMNTFLANGGDGFTAFTGGTDQLGGPVDIDALEAYFAANSPVAPGPMNRITRTG